MLKRKITAVLGTIVCAFLVEMPDPFPLIDEALLMFVIVKLWGWAGVDLLSFFSKNTESKSGSRIIEID